MKAKHAVSTVDKDGSNQGGHAETTFNVFYNYYGKEEFYIVL